MNVRSFRTFFFCISVFLAACAASAEPASPLRWSGSTEIAIGGGLRGPWQQNESRYDYVDDPTVALNDRGESSVAWVDQGRKDVFFQRYSSDGTKLLDQPVNVSRNSATLSWLPRVVIAPDSPQKIFILWQEIIFSGGSHGGDILFARSDDGGISFSQPINLSGSIGGDGKGRINQEIWHNGSLDLFAGADGALYAAWTEYDGPLWFSRSTDGGKNFSRPRSLAGSKSHPARAPSLAIAPDQTLYLAWTVGEDNGADIRLAKSTDGGTTFSEPQIVASSKNYSDAPKLAVDRAGNLHMVYAESSGGPFARYRIHYTRSADGGRTLDKPRDISDAMPKSVASAAFPSLSIDAKGNLYIIWELIYDTRQRPRGLGLTVSTDAGKNFTQSIVVPDSSDPESGFNGSQQGLLMKKLAVNSTGAVTIVNSSLKQDERSRVWMVRGEIRDGPAGSGTAEPAR